jgi:NAD(P)-dependent dehydrogenase (short-subunit alcohol dehydrogenase family)
MGVPVTGNRRALPEVVRRYRADAVLIAIPSASAELVRELSTLAGEMNVDVKVVPPVVELFGRTVRIEDIRPVSHADLLGRREIGIDLAAIAGYLTGKRVLVTGGSKGIGFACGMAFAAEGCDVILASRDAAALDKAAGAIRARHNVNVAVHAGDLSRPEARTALHRAHGGVDVLVNNAGAIPGGTVHDIALDRWIEAWNLKVFGYIHLTQLYLPMMERRGSGVIVNIIGMAGRAPRADYICGAAGNAALIAFTGALGGRSTDKGVRVVGISPGATRTDRIITLSKSRAKTKFGDESRWEEMLSGLSLGRAGKPEEIADLAVFCASPRGGYLSGSTLDVDAGAQFRS